MSSVLERKQSATQLSDARISPLAGKPAPREILVDLARLEKEYFDCKPDLEDANQFVVFGTSGHRGTSLNGTFTEAHVLAITQAICDYRKAQGITGPLYMGKDTHALSSPAQCSALEVLAANNVETIIQERRWRHTNAGYLTCHPGVQPHSTSSLGRWHHHHTFPQSSGRRRFQVQPAQRRPRRYGGHALGTGSGKQSLASRQSRSETNFIREGNQSTFHPRGRFGVALRARI